MIDHPHSVPIETEQELATLPLLWAQALDGDADVSADLLAAVA